MKKKNNGQNLTEVSNEDIKKTGMNDKQIKAIELLFTGQYNYTEIADQCGISRQTLYNWLQNQDFLNILDARKREIWEYIGRAWFTIFRISTDGLLKRVKDNDIDSQEFALKCLLASRRGEGGILLLPDNMKTAQEEKQGIEKYRFYVNQIQQVYFEMNNTERAIIDNEYKEQKEYFRQIELHEESGGHTLFCECDKCTEYRNTKGTDVGYSKYLKAMGITTLKQWKAMNDKEKKAFDCYRVSVSNGSFYFSGYEKDLEDPEIKKAFDMMHAGKMGSILDERGK
jgi:hypothetical protein